MSCREPIVPKHWIQRTLVWVTIALVSLSLPEMAGAAEVSASSTRQLFRAKPVVLAKTPALERGVVWQRSARVDWPSLQGAVAGELGFAVDGVRDDRLQIQAIETDAAGRWVAKGVVAGVPLSRALFLVRAGQFAGTVRIPGDGIYVMSGPVDGECVVRKLDPLQIPRCGVTDMDFQNAALEKYRALQAAGEVPPKEPVPNEKLLDEILDELPDGEVRPLNEPTVTLDMMVIYTAASRTGAGGKAAIETLIELAIIEANDCFVNSQINLKLNLAHTRELAYSETGDMQDDLYNLAFGLSGLGEVDNLRTIQFKTDLVCLITEREDTGYIAGIAYLLQSPSGNSTFPSYSVVRRAYAVGDYTFAHEVGHNLGCAHDRNNSGSPGAFAYAYGHRFNAAGITYATVMTYPPGVRIPYFSNPNVVYNGVPSGVPDGFGNSADNAAAINQTGPVVAAYRTAARRYSFAQTSFEVSEGATQAAITVRRSGSSTSQMSIAYATSNGSAVAGQDFTASSGTLAFAAGQTNATLFVPVTNDALAESPESFVITLSDPKPSGFSGLGANYQTTVVIKDNENGFHFEIAATTASESAGSVALKVLREGTGPGTAMVTVRPVAGTALAGTDLVATDQVLTFAAGEMEKTATIGFVNDFVAEPDKAFTVSLVNPTAGYAVTAPTTASVSLLDDDRMGAHDLAFNAEAGPNDIVFASVVRPNGNVIVGGSFSQFDGLVRAGVAELNLDGTLNSGFDPGIGVSGTVYSMALRPDGRLVIGGAFTAVNGIARLNLAQLNVDGSLDLSFDPGQGPDEAVRSLALAAEDKVVIGGFFSSFAGQTRIYLARVNANGGLDTSFVPAAPNSPVRAVAVQPDNKVVIGGDFTQVGASTRPFLARLNANGSLDTGFSAFLNARVRGLALMADGDVLAGGEFASANGFGYSQVARLNSDGTTDTGFNLAARPDGFVRVITVQADQKILIGGDFTTIGGQPAGRVARLNAAGDVDANFQTGAGANAIVYALAVDPGRYAVVGGEFSNFAGVPRSRVARVRIVPNAEAFEPVIVPLVRGDVTGGPITVHFEGRAGSKYALDGSDNLATWTGVVTNTAVANAAQLTDPTPPTSRRFYRIRQVP